MKKGIIRLVYGLALLCLSQTAFGQNNVGINTETPNSRAVLQLVSPTNDQGFLVPGLTTAQRTAISFTTQLSSSENSLLVFDIDLNTFYYWVDNGWVALSSQNLAVGAGLNISGNTISNTGDLDPTNEIQDLSLSVNTLAITANGSATQIDLSPYLDNTDAQALSLTGTSLAISGGNSVDLASLKDGTGTDDQQLSLAANSLSLEDGGSVDLSGYLDNTDAQSLSLTGTSLAISGGNSVDLASLQDGTGTDDQQLSLAANSLSLEDGGSVDLSGYLDNTDAQSLSLTGTSLAISGGNSVDLASLQDGIGTDDQQLSLVTNTLSLEDGGSVDLSIYLDNTDSQNLTDVLGNGNSAGSVQISDLADPLANQDAATKAYVDAQVSAVDINDADSDPSNELQDLSLSGNTLTLTGLTTPTAIDLSPYAGTNTDNQTLSFAANSLSISGGNTVDLSALQDGTGTDDQALTFDRNILQLENGGSVDLSGYLDNTDAQTLALTGTSLSISGGNSVDLTAVQDGTGTDNQTIDELSLATGILSISLSGDGQPAQTVDLSSLQDGTGTDNQTLSLVTNILSISGGNSVSLAAYTKLTESQVDTYVSNNGYLTSIPGGEDVKVISPDEFRLIGTSETVVYGLDASNGMYVTMVNVEQVRVTGSLFAGVNIDRGKAIKSITAVINTNQETSTQDATLTLYSQDYGAGRAPKSVGLPIVASAKSGINEYTVNLDEGLDATSRFYYLVFQGEVNGPTPIAALYQVRITYTY